MLTALTVANATPLVLEPQTAEAGQQGHGDESRQLRDGLVRRMRQRRVSRRGLSPSPSR